MVHVTVGTANAVGAHHQRRARSNVPMLFTAGRTPITEAGLPGAATPTSTGRRSPSTRRDGPRVREVGLRAAQPVQLETVVDRALSSTRPSRRVPSTSRCRARCWRQPLGELTIESPSRRHGRGRPLARPARIAEAAGCWPPRGTRCHRQGRRARSRRRCAALVALAEAVGDRRSLEASPTYINFPPDHPLHAGYARSPAARSRRPTRSSSSSPTCRGSRLLKRPRTTRGSIQLGGRSALLPLPDPRLPVRLPVAADPAVTLAAARGGGPPACDPAAVAARRARSRRAHARARRWAARRARGRARPNAHRHAWVSRCVGDLVGRRHHRGQRVRARLATRRLRAPGSLLRLARRRAGSAGGSAPRSAPSSAAPDKTVIAASATAPTSSARPPPPLRGAALQAAGPHGDLQQPRLERGEAAPLAVHPRRLGRGDRARAAVRLSRRRRATR